MSLSRITSASIANSAISAADIADGTITAAKIISVANTQITGNIVSSQIASNQTLNGNVSVTGTLAVSGATSGAITIAAPAVAGSGVLTLPTGTDTLIGKATTDVLTNKSIAATQLTGTIAAAALPAGSVLQVVNSQTAITQVSTTSTSYVTSGITVSITPKFATSKIFVVFNSSGYVASGTGSYTFYRNSTNLESSYLGFCEIVGTALYQPIVMTALDSPATTSSTSYTLYYKNTNGVAIFASLTGTTTVFTLMEIAG
jgi:hypothetical protein